jgi:hypothetical protein
VACPWEIEFLSGPSKTGSGKTLGRLLKARELNLLRGDTSTLEEEGLFKKGFSIK